MHVCMRAHMMHPCMYKQVCEFDEYDMMCVCVYVNANACNCECVCRSSQVPPKLAHALGFKQCN